MSTRAPVDRRLLAAWLRAIPQSRHAPRPLEELPGGDVIGRGLATMLQVWGAVEVSEAGIRAVSQPAYYFLHSLAAWAETTGSVVLDWSEQLGTMPGEGLRHGTSLVYLLEQERLRRDPQAPPIRHTPVAQVLIVQPGSPPTFLTQWDARAGAYQLIGGRQKRDGNWVEPIEETAIRELEEELGGQVRFAAGDFRVEPLATFTGSVRLSPSFGALTAYHFHFFRACDLPPIRLHPDDRWVTRAELLGGATVEGRPLRGDHIPPLEAVLGRSIETLPSSFRASKS